MGKKSKRVRNKQTKEELEESRMVLESIVLGSWLLGLPHMSKKGLKKKTNSAVVCGKWGGENIKIKGYNDPREETPSKV